MLAQQRRFGRAAEKVAENILADLFAEVLDWTRTGINYQVGFADMILTDLARRWLIVEVKRPDALVWDRRAVNEALDQARRYADEQGVKTIAVSDGRMFYAADLVDGGLRDRLFVALDAQMPPRDLWWVSLHGIYRERPGHAGTGDPDLLTGSLATADAEIAAALASPDVLLHGTYHLPARCFAYVGRADRPQSWKLPYLLEDGSVDRKRLPKAIGAILTNYRGARVRAIPEEAVAPVLGRLADAARQLGLMPPEAASPAPVYRQLADALEALKRTGQG